MSIVIEKKALPIPADEAVYSLINLGIIERNLPKEGGPPTRETVRKICIDDDLVDDSQKEEILRYLIMMSSLGLQDLKLLWEHIPTQQGVSAIFSGIKSRRRDRERTDWKPRWATDHNLS